MPGSSSSPKSNADFELRHWHHDGAKHPSLPRRRRLAVPAMLDTYTSAFELQHWRPADRSSYTSIRDVIASSPSGYNSPTAASGYDIQIKNPLLKQAAYAYLQPTPSAIDRRRRRQISVRSCLSFVGRILRSFCSGKHR